MTREELLRSLRRRISDERVLDAIAAVPRELFVSPALAPAAYEDAPLRIGSGQTISQPTVVARMCELLELSPTDRVLDVGTGLGYHAAVLSRLCTSLGHSSIRIWMRAPAHSPGGLHNCRLRRRRCQVCRSMRPSRDQRRATARDHVPLVTPAAARRWAPCRCRSRGRHEPLGAPPGWDLVHEVLEPVRCVPLHRRPPTVRYPNLTFGGDSVRRRGTA